MYHRIAQITVAVLTIAGAGLGIAAPAAATASPVPGDPLTGSGAVSRSLLTAAHLNGGSSTGTISNDAFALPANAKAPSNQFEGTLTLNAVGTSGGFSSLKDPYGYSTDTALRHLPPMGITLVQNGSHLIPATRGVQITGSPYWNLAVGPGRAWNETGDGSKTRASLPFALIERNANCVHNGVLTFLFDAGSTSNVRYQVTNETCEYFQFDMWGQLGSTYAPGPVANAEALKTAFAAEVGNRLPTRPITALATDYPGAGIDVAAFSSGITPAAMSTFGFFYGGFNYVGGCTTRQGAYPYCGQMLLPSYSTAKSAFAGMALMRMGQKFGGGVYGQTISANVPEAAAKSAWNGVTWQNTLNMATGNYDSPDYEVDEAGSTMLAFFAAEPYAQKMSSALGFPRKAAPGSSWNYHSSDTFVATKAMNNYLQSREGSSRDIFTMVRDDVFARINLSPDAQTTLRTDNSPTGSAFGGYGLFWTQDDIAKVSKFLTVDNGAANGQQILNPSMLDDTMQRNPANRGVTTSGTTAFKYNNGFWAKEFTSADSPTITTPFHVPFMSGFGGISVALMPNGASYYAFSDNNEFAWTGTVLQAMKLAPMTTGPAPTCPAANLLGNGGFETGTAAPWTASPAVVDNRALQPARTGSWKAWLNGFGSANTETLSQSVSIPAACTSAHLTFSLRIDSAETLPNAYDGLSLAITPNGGTGTVLGTWSNLDESGYVQRTFDLSAYAGQTVSVQFTGTEDYSKQTSFVIDDSTLNVG